MTDVAIATEDELSEIICRKLLGEVGIKPFLELRRGGSGYLRGRIPSFCQMAQNYPVIVLTDLDLVVCAPRLVADWLRNQIVPQNFLLRVAVREVESWLLADGSALSSYFGVEMRVDSVENISDPKQFLLEKLRRSQRAIRTSVVNVRRGQAYCGVGYNNELAGFVREAWSPERASQHSDSLSRMRRRISEMTSREQREGAEVTK
ncbi:DUF4276 family protein [Xanthomonas campestris]|uniref:DUF4276 family protein n=1 Tax=Xanthomonas campestris TaxID=339 RepID=UPI001E4A06B1|nr:DUF4276 family protein [Xanthomonas campestris]MCC5062667.1 DUF4276 family protein [Xanthomonas campestris pv. raphani]MEA9889516.1 DUF4276 family protein [Xanthomonas campestris pv. raphani]MEA9974119.1 DUF4276 family protein [Xanthomonas campestris pv. raphani]